MESVLDAVYELLRRRLREATPQAQADTVTAFIRFVADETAATATAPVSPKRRRNAHDLSDRPRVSREALKIAGHISESDKLVPLVAAEGRIVSLLMKVPNPSYRYNAIIDDNLFSFHLPPVATQKQLIASCERDHRFSLYVMFDDSIRRVDDCTIVKATDGEEDLGGRALIFSRPNM